MKEKIMDIWKWDGGYGIGWLSEKMSDVGGIVDNSLSREMEKLNLRYLWEKPMDRLCDACNHVSGFFGQRTDIKRKLAEWIASLEVAVIGQYRLMERILNEEGKNLLALNSQQSTNYEPNPHLVSLGYISKMPIASRSTIVWICDNLDTMQDVARTITLRVCDFEGKACNLIDRQLELRVVMLYSDGEECDISVSRAVRIGEYNLCFRALRPGRATLSVKLHGTDVAGSPRNIVIHPVKNWSHENIVPSFFGGEGEAPGDFQRPWGIACDRQGRLLVADRTNNRVQVFKEDGTFVLEFGRKGTGSAEFQLVSAVAGSPNGDLVCVDKDNHRIQVFDEDGCFKFAFGRLGEKPGEFHYPWDVDVNARGEIIVTDSRNSRIQLFTAAGKFVKEFCRADCQTMDSPRGVCFINTNEVAMTEFNKQLLIIVNLRTKKHRVICQEGSKAGQLKRPQGVAWHPQGFIVIGDSRNNRIQAVDRHGTMIWEFGSHLAHHDQLDRPCGVAITKKGNIAAVDLGNNRVVMLQ